MGNPFAHIELNTSHLGKARAFYEKLFDWKVKPYDGGNDYLAVQTSKSGTGGGMQQSPMPEAPPAWLPYVLVADVKKSLAKAKKLGGKVMLDYEEIGDLGAIGIFTDPQGAPLGVWQQKKRAKKK
ncbi:MAG: VOC family protein [Archangium sp.]